jgi:hypothetical protein
VPNILRIILSWLTEGGKDQIEAHGALISLGAPWVLSLLEKVGQYINWGAG